MIDPSDDFIKFIKGMEKENTGKNLSDQEAWEGANNLIGFFDLLLRIDRRNKNAKCRRNKKNIER